MKKQAKTATGKQAMTTEKAKVSLEKPANAKASAKRRPKVGTKETVSIGLISEGTVSIGVLVVIIPAEAHKVLISGL